MSIVRVKGKAQITLPARIRRVLDIQEGDYLQAEVKGNKIVLTPQAVTDREPVTLSAEGERIVDEALEEVRRGMVEKYDTIEELIEALHHETPED